jgi:hypothetical protein
MNYVNTKLHSIASSLKHYGKTAIRRKALLLLSAATVFATLNTSKPLYAQTAQPRVQIVLTRLFCGHTTESGHDEVYYLLGGVNGSGTSIGKRGPNATQGADADDRTAWDMNDSGSQQDRYLNAVIYEAPLLPGENATLNLGLVESDGTPYGKTLEAAGKIALSQGTNPWVIVSGALASILSQYLPGSNQDDVLGGFRVQVRNNNNQLEIVNTSPASYTTLWRGVNNGTFAYEFNHDDGHYWAFFKVNLIN